MDSERPVPQQGLLLQDLLRGTYPTRHVAPAAEVGRVVVVDATCHVGLEAAAGGRDEVVGLAGLQGVILVEKW